MKKKYSAILIILLLTSILVTGCTIETEVVDVDTKTDTKIATQAHSFRCGLVAQQYKLFNKLNYIFNFTMEIFTYAI